MNDLVERILVATDRSATATKAVQWAADMSTRYSAELLIVQVILPENVAAAREGGGDVAEEELGQLARELAGERGRARVVYDSDPAQALVDVAAKENADIIVVGNVGMRERSEFLLGSVPNRVSHNAPCSVVIVNTAGTVRTAKPSASAAAGDGVAILEEGQLLGRAAQIGAVIAKHQLHRKAGEDPARARAMDFRDMLQELGPTFSKLGQILSTRADLLPTAFVEELAQLQDRVTPLTEAQVVEAMERELKVPWEDVFKSIEPDPMAAGTIAQVHRAALQNGDRVVVKVQRPTAEHDITRDLGLLDMFIEKAGQREALRGVIDLPAVVQQLSQSLRRELDFREEADNIERMGEVLKPFPRLAVPRVLRDISTKRLLVMDEIQGVPIRNVPQGDARKEAARQLLESYYRQVMIDGFFHADPHPGNLMWWNDKIYFLDLGMVGTAGEDLREKMMLMLLALWQEDADFLAQVMVMLSGGEARSDLDLPAFRNELAELVTKYRSLSLAELQLGPLLQELTEISVRHHIRLPAELAMTGKAFGQMQLATAELDPTLDPMSVAASFFMRSMGDRLRGSASPQRLFYDLQKGRLRLERLVEAIESVTGARPGPKLQVDFRGTERVEQAIRHAGRRAGLALGGGAGLVSSAIVVSGSHPVTWVAWLFGGAGGLLLVALLRDLARRQG